jgi:hypothetical protein
MKLTISVICLVTIGMCQVSIGVAMADTFGPYTQTTCGNYVLSNVYIDTRPDGTLVMRGDSSTAHLNATPHIDHFTLYDQYGGLLGTLPGGSLPTISDTMPNQGTHFNVIGGHFDPSQYPIIKKVAFSPNWCGQQIPASNHPNHPNNPNQPRSNNPNATQCTTHRGFTTCQNVGGNL